MVSLWGHLEIRSAVDGKLIAGLHCDSASHQPGRKSGRCGEIFERRAEEGRGAMYVQVAGTCRLALVSNWSCLQSSAPLYTLLLGFEEELPALVEKPLDHDVEVCS
jgi:hypothetical protein